MRQRRIILISPQSVAQCGLIKIYPFTRLYTTIKKVERKFKQILTLRLVAKAIQAFFCVFQKKELYLQLVKQVVL